MRTHKQKIIVMVIIALFTFAKGVERKPQQFTVTVTLVFKQQTLKDAMNIEKRIIEEFKNDSCKIDIKIDTSLTSIYDKNNWKKVILPNKYYLQW
jgi:hypothetical protein